MSLLTVNSASGVYYREIDLSFFPRGRQATGIAAAFYSKRGKANDITVQTNRNDFFREYGLPDPQVSPTHQQLAICLGETTLLYCMRVANQAKFGGLVINKSPLNKLNPPTGLVAEAFPTYGTLDVGNYSYKVSALDGNGETLASTAATVEITDTSGTNGIRLRWNRIKEAIGYRIYGRLAGSEEYLYEILLDGTRTEWWDKGVLVPNGAQPSTDSMSEPVNVNVRDVSSDYQGGSLVDGTYSYIITAIDEYNGETLGSTAASIVLNSSGANTEQVVEINWEKPENAPYVKAYNIYGRTAAGEEYITSVPGNVTTFIDKGTITPSTGETVPITNSTQSVGNTTSSIKLRPFATGKENVANEISWNTGDIAAVHGINPGDWNKEISIDIHSVSETLEKTFTTQIYENKNNIPTESWEVSLIPQVDGFGQQLYAEEKINNFSDLINILVRPVNYEDPIDDYYYRVDNIVKKDVTLEGGDDGLAITDDDLSLALDKFYNKDLVDPRIIIDGGYSSVDIQLKIDQICKKRHDVIGVGSIPPQFQDINNLRLYRKTDLVLDSSYFALYAPDALINDPISRRDIYVGMGCFGATAMARTDAIRNPWEGPFGIIKGEVNGAKALRHYYDQGELNLATDLQINTARKIGNSFKIMDALTTQTQYSLLSFIEVRRMLIFLYINTMPALIRFIGEPADTLVMEQIEAVLRGILEPIVRGRGLYRYRIQCDLDSTPQYELEQGKIYANVYLWPVPGVRQILFTPVVMNSRVEFQDAREIIGAAA